MTASAVKRSSDNFAHHRGGAAKRRNLRTDRDGDLVMEGPKRDRIGKGPSASRGRGGSINTAALQREVLRHVGSDNRTGGPPRGPRPKSTAQSSLSEIKITGWANSKASTSPDRGVSSLITFLEKHASKRGSLFRQNGRSPAQTAKVRSSRVEGDNLYITVPSEEVSVYAKINGFVFAGQKITITGDGIRGKSPQIDNASPEPANDIKQIFQDFLGRRYNADSKLLSLNALASDEELRAVGIFNTTTTQSKFFPALMKICEAQFQTAQEKKDTIESVTLAENNLSNIAPVTTLGQTFPDLKNLDLSGNKFESTSAMIGWRHKFRHLEHLILSNNPLEQSQPGWEVEILQWFPRLRMLNGAQVRTEEQVAQLNQPKKVPLLVRGPNFEDDGNIAQDFILKFFAGFDGDRTALANTYYDATSTFSLNVNTHAIRDPTKHEMFKKQSWDAYIRLSRNLKHLTHPGPRSARKFQGPQEISKVWSQLPTTQHPSLATEFHKWSIDCIPQEGVPDPSGQYPQGVGGFLITIHGEYNETSSAAGAGTMQRSFDRTFILGPGGPTGVRVVSDLWTVRAYGGFAAFKPEEPQQNQVVAGVPQIAIMGGLTPEQEVLLAEVARATGMNLKYSKECLDTSGWNLQNALATFEAHRANLGPEAFA